MCSISGRTSISASDLGGFEAGLTKVMSTFANFLNCLVKNNNVTRSKFDKCVHFRESIQDRMSHYKAKYDPRELIE